MNPQIENINNQKNKEIPLLIEKPVDKNESPEKNMSNLEQKTQARVNVKNYEFQCSIEEQWNDIDKYIHICHSDKWTELATNLLNSYWFKQLEA